MTVPGHTQASVQQHITQQNMIGASGENVLPVNNINRCVRIARQVTFRCQYQFNCEALQHHA